MFDQSSITAVSKPVYSQAGLRLAWKSNAPKGTPFQVYADGKLIWHGVTRYCDLPLPPPGVNQHFEVGAVAFGEEQTDFSGTLISLAPKRALLTWLGGTYLDASGNDDIIGFRVYGESAPGGGIDYSKRLAEIPAYFNGVITDGWGEGGWGQGGWGKSASSYTWTSDVLAAGQWSFAVRSVDSAGNEGTAMVTRLSIDGPPAPPPRFDDDERVHFAWNGTARTVVLSWQASPG
jgi:hypothetical protein